MRHLRLQAQPRQQGRRGPLAELAVALAGAVSSNPPSSRNDQRELPESAALAERNIQRMTNGDF